MSAGAVSPRLLAIARNVVVDGVRGLPLPPRSGRLSQLAARLASLSPRERELLELKYGAGATARTIGRLTGLSESHVQTRLSQVVASLRAAWTGDSSLPA